MAEIELISVPFDGYGRPGNQALAADWLLASGLARAFGRHRVHETWLELPAPDGRRGADAGLINEPALVAMTDALAELVAELVGATRFPVVVGGDCSTLLGIMGGLAAAVRDPGLVFVDGHEDTMPLDVSEDGEAANAELGLLLRLTGRLVSGPLRSRVGLLGSDGVAVLGPRDRPVNRVRFHVQHDGDVARRGC